jgi:hypothetical protein
MERLGFEPFGERLGSRADSGAPSHVSRSLLWGGTGLFWLLVVTIVLARAAFFEPGIFDSFTRVVLLVRNLIF